MCIKHINQNTKKSVAGRLRQTYSTSWHNWIFAGCKTYRVTKEWVFDQVVRALTRSISKDRLLELKCTSRHFGL